MAYYSLHAYDADLWIPLFSGLQQAEDIASDMRYAIEAENVETPRGVLQPMASPDVEDFVNDNKIGTLARFHRRWYTGTGSKDWMIAAAGGKLFYRQEGTSTWTQVPMPNMILESIPSEDHPDGTVTINASDFADAVSSIPGHYMFSYSQFRWSAFREVNGEYIIVPGMSSGSLQFFGIAIDWSPSSTDRFDVYYRDFTKTPYLVSDVWSFVTYEINVESSLNPIDVLLMSNDQIGMIMVIPPYGNTAPENDWQIKMIDTRGDRSKGFSTDGPKFGVIERYAERIWGGAVPKEPDSLYYSVPYDPTDWRGYPDPNDPEKEDALPEDGGGVIKQPSWDGDSFIALKAFGDQLIAFKKHHVWRVMGTNPGEYTFKEQYGGGSAYPNSIVVDTERILMAEQDGLSAYDGMSVVPFSRPSIEDYWKRVNRSCMGEMCAALFKHRYYLAVPVDGSTVNNALFVYNIEENSFLFYTDIFIESMIATDQTLYATSSTTPGKIMTINYDSWETGVSSGKQTKWKTAWIDFGRKSIAKGGYEIYFLPEVKGGPVTFRFSIETEKKSKSKLVTVQTTTFKAKQKRIRFGGTSRRFRVTIETISVPKNTVWRLLGGIQMVVEIDPD